MTWLKHGHGIIVKGGWSTALGEVARALVYPVSSVSTDSRNNCEWELRVEVLRRAAASTL